jgi:hypothetical protein
MNLLDRITSLLIGFIPFAAATALLYFGLTPNVVWWRFALAVAGVWVLIASAARQALQNR